MFMDWVAANKPAVEDKGKGAAVAAPFSFSALPFWVPRLFQRERLGKVGVVDDRVDHATGRMSAVVTRMAIAPETVMGSVPAPGAGIAKGRRVNEI